MKELTILLPDRLVRHLRKAADEEGERLIDIIRIALEVWIEKYEENN